MLTASSSSRGELINAAEGSFENITYLADEVKASASCLGSDKQEAQVKKCYSCCQSTDLYKVMLLNTVKDVCGSLMGLLIHAKNANGQPLEHPAYEQVSDYSKVSVSFY